MKRLTKFLGVICAACMLVLTAAPVFAVEVYYLPAYDESVVYGLVDSGTLEDETEYWVINLTPAETAQRSMARSFDWSDKVTVPIANTGRSNSKTLGNSFTVYPDSYVIVNVGSLPSSMSSVDVGFYYDNDSKTDWVPNAGSNSMVVFKLKYPSTSGCLKVSTQESKSTMTGFSFATSETNPADSYIEV